LERLLQSRPLHNPKDSSTAKPLGMHNALNISNEKVFDLVGGVVMTTIAIHQFPLTKNYMPPFY
jgi:hypothetical protein